MTEASLYTLASAPRVGSETDATVLAGGSICQRCHQAEVRRVERLSLAIERYAGEALIATGRSFVVTIELRSAIEAAGLTGCAFRAMDLVRSPRLDDAIVVPPLEELVITGRAEAASSWWRRQGTCPLCRRAVWRMTHVTTNAIFAAARGEVAPPRAIYRERWAGDDFFLGDDPGPPFVTSRARDVLVRFATPMLSLHPARFVRDRRKWV